MYDKRISCCLCKFSCSEISKRILVRRLKGSQLILSSKADLTPLPSHAACGSVSSRKHRGAKVDHGDLRPRIPRQAQDRCDQHRNSRVREADKDRIWQAASQRAIPSPCSHRTDHRPPQERSQDAAQLPQRPDRRHREPVHGRRCVQFPEVHPVSVFLCASNSLGTYFDPMFNPFRSVPDVAF